MHSKRRYKICIWPVILGELEAFRNYKGFSDILLLIYESDDFSYSPLHHIFESKNFSFPTKITLTQGGKYEKLNFI